MLIDTRIINRIGAHEILAQRHEVMFPADGQAVWLHPVRLSGVLHRSKRAMASDGGALVLFDLAAVDRSLDGDLCCAADRDRAGLVLYALRQKYATKAAFVTEVRKHALAVVEPDLQVAA